MKIIIPRIIVISSAIRFPLIAFTAHSPYAWDAPDLLTMDTKIPSSTRNTRRNALSPMALVIMLKRTLIALNTSNPVNNNVPENTPIISAEYTSFVSTANRIVINGGTSAHAECANEVHSLLLRNP